MSTAYAMSLFSCIVCALILEKFYWEYSQTGVLAVWFTAGGSSKRLGYSIHIDSTERKKCTKVDLCRMYLRVLLYRTLKSINPKK